MKVNKTDDGFECECGFSSSGWEKKKMRDERAKQHLAEHEHGAVMPELAEFWKGENK